MRRKKGGVYSARDRQPEPPSEVSSNGKQDGAEERRSFPNRRGTSGDDVIPELPADLFDWPEPRGNEEPRRRYRGDRGDATPEPFEGYDDDPDGFPEPPPGPPRI